MARRLFMVLLSLLPAFLLRRVVPRPPWAVGVGWGLRGRTWGAYSVEELGIQLGSALRGELDGHDLAVMSRMGRRP